MEAIAGEINIVGDDHARVLRKSRQRGRSHRGIRGRSANGSLKQLRPARIKKNFWFGKAQNQSNCEIKTRHVGGGNTVVPAKVKDGRRPAGKAVEHENIRVIGVEWSLQAIKV